MDKQLLLTQEDVLQKLTSLGIQYIMHTHPAVFTMQDMNTHIKLQKGVFIKNVFFYDKKDNFYLVMCEPETKIEKAFWKHFCQVSAGNIRLTQDEHIVNVLKSKKGAVNPFAVANDTENKVKYVVLDVKLRDAEYFSFHPNDNTATLEISNKDFFKFMEAIGRKVLVANLEFKEEQKPAQEIQQQQGAEKDDQTLKIQFKKEYKTFAKWYSQVITKGELIDYYDISGCYVLRPWAYGIWERIQDFFNILIKETGVQNCYFPMFVSESALNKEKEHVEGFAPEVAWVTKSGTTDLKEKIAIRPTSETIMYPLFKKWISSHRDLPLKLNQWTNIVRWEFKHPTPFIRTREFLWQEGHTAHSSNEDANETVFQILDFYRRVYEELLAVPVIKGIKTQSEKFAGGDFTSTIETCIPVNGRAIQAATSHNLGQNFSKMFKIEYFNEQGEKHLAWQTSWGLTTRSIGCMVMYHADNQGLIIPPRVAQIQVVIIGIIGKNINFSDIDQRCKEVLGLLNKNNIRAYYDNRDVYTPGWKFNNWELKGVPLRFEIGPKDLQSNEVRAVKRNDGKKFQIKMDNLLQTTHAVLEEIQGELFKRACDDLQNRKKEAKDWKDFMNELNQSNIILTPWCTNDECEKQVKEKSGLESKMIQEEEVKEDQNENEHFDQKLTGAAKTLCIPLEQKPIEANEKCFHCGQPAVKRVFWGRSY